MKYSIGAILLCLICVCNHAKAQENNKAKETQRLKTTTVVNKGKADNPAVKKSTISKDTISSPAVTYEIKKSGTGSKENKKTNTEIPDYNLQVSPNPLLRVGGNGESKPVKYHN